MKKYILLVIGILFFTESALAGSFTFSNNLSLGSRGTDVSELQTFLISNGYDIPSVSSRVVSKGYFGVQTKSAVIKYQASQNLPTTGFVGSLTRAKLNGGVVNNSSLKIISPNGGENWKLGTIQTIRWNAPAYFKANHADLMLVPYYSPCTTQICPMLSNTSLPYRAPYRIVASVSIDNHFYDWNVGNVSDVAMCEGCTPAKIPSGQYKMQICEVGTYVCDESDSYFTVSEKNSSNLSPIISSIESPTTLSVGSTGTWTVKASDPENGQLTYLVDWGDVYSTCYDNCNIPLNSASVNNSFVQSSTFSHSYKTAGTYTVKFSVRDDAGNETNSSITVRVDSITLIRTCPSEKINNKMPTINSQSNSSYFIYNGVRHELSEFDLNWVNNNCSVKETDVY